jgi:predicted CopG family antitoxin
MPKQMKITDDVYKRLTDLGKKNETYSQIISRLIDDHFELEKMKRKHG